MAVEDVAGECLASRGPPQEERKLAIGHGLLRQVVVDHQRMAALVHEVLGHRAAGVGSDVLQRRRIARPGHDDRRVVQGSLAAQYVDQAGHVRFLLPDRHVEALHSRVLLVDDRVDADGRLARLAVADDQLALAAADRGHGVDGLDPRLERLLDRLPRSHARGHRLHRPPFGRDDRPAAVQRIAQRVDDAAQHRLAHWHAQQLSGAADFVPLVDREIVAEDRHPDRVLFEVERQAVDARGKLDHLAGHDAGQPVDPGDAVADLQDAPDFADVDPGFVLLNFLPDNGSDLVGFESHGHSCRSFALWRC